MVKSYSEQLDEWVEQRSSSRRDKNLVQFLAVKSDIEVALAKGFAVSTIWRHMVAIKRVDFCYDTFLLYVNRLVRQGARVKATGAKRPSSPATASGQKANAAPPEPVRGFTFNPFVNIEDLI